MVGERQNNLSTLRAWGRQKLRKGWLSILSMTNQARQMRRKDTNTWLKAGHYSILFITLAMPARILYFSPAAPMETLHLFMAPSLFLVLPDRFHLMAFLKSESPLRLSCFPCYKIYFDLFS